MNDGPIFQSAKYDPPPNDRLPEAVHDLADTARAARARWISAEDQCIRADRAARAASAMYAAALRDAAADARPASEVDDPRERLAAEAARSRDLARVTREQAQSAYYALCAALMASPAAALAAADELPEAMTARIVQLRSDLAEALEELRQAMPARVWVSRVLKPRAGHQPFDAWAGPRLGHAPTPPDDALDQLREAERKRQAKHDGLFARMPSQAATAKNNGKTRVT